MLLKNSRPAKPDCSVNAVLFTTARQSGYVSYTSTYTEKSRSRTSPESGNMHM